MVGGLIIKGYVWGDANKIDLSKPIPKGIYGVYNLNVNCSNVPSELSNFNSSACTIIGTGTTDLIIGADAKYIVSRYNDSNKPKTWIKLI